MRRRGGRHRESDQDVGREAERRQGIATRHKIKTGQHPLTDHRPPTPPPCGVGHLHGDRLSRTPPSKLGVEPIRSPHLLPALLPLRVLLLEEVGDHERDVCIKELSLAGTLPRGNTN